MSQEGVTRVLARAWLALVMGMASASGSHAALNCQAGSTLQEVAQNVLGIQRGAETADDINVALGIIPEAIISERVREATENAGELLSKISKLREYCKLIAAKNDPVEQYFLGIDLLFASTPMAPWVTLNVDMARVIVASANSISANRLSDSLLYQEGVGVNVHVEVRKYRKFHLWNLWLTGDSLKQSDPLRQARLLVRPKTGGGQTQVRDLAVERQATSYQVVNDLSVFGFDPKSNHLFFEFLWKNGQRSVVPLANGFYKSGAGPSAVFPFLLKDQNMVLDR